MLSTPFTDLLGCRLPLQQAPMGGVTTPELVAAVAGAGAVGMVPAQMLPAEALAGLLTDLAGRADGVVGVTFLVPFGAGRSSFNARPSPPVSFDRQPTPAERLADRQRGALDLGLAPGDEVVHRQWGLGVVSTISGQGERAMAEVDFPGLGRKRLLLRYAPLTRP